MAFCRQRYVHKLLRPRVLGFKDNLLSLRYYFSQRPLSPLVNIDDCNIESEEFKEIVEYSSDKRIFYNCLINNHKPKLPHYKEKAVFQKISLRKKIELYKSSVPLIVEKLKNTESISNKFEDDKSSRPINLESNNSYYNKNEQFPFSRYEEINLKDVKIEKETKENEATFKNDSFSLKEDISIRLKAYNEDKDKISQFPQMELPDEDLPLKFYKDSLLTDLQTNKNKQDENEGLYFGTPDPEVPKSSVPCGGCGSHLHCQDEGLPGYIPSEEFCGKSKRDLRTLVCQRCYFLRAHNAALNVRVSPEMYEEALKPIADTRALVIVVVDLLDVPCSVWPKIHNLIGNKRPVVVVGNKIDLLPLDNVDYVDTIQKSLTHSIKNTSLGKTNVKHVCVISAKTGYGIEDLISHIQIKWGVKGDIYLLGCTNAGKSTLFNAFLGSDLCKVQASNLIRRATASPWPGTTISLLKFPIMRPTGKVLYNRKLRLKKEKKLTVLQREKYENKKTMTLTGHVGQTYSLNPAVNTKGEVRVEEDSFGINPFVIPKERKESVGINDKNEQFRYSKWCFDTPGTVQPDQFLGLLTHEELLDVLPRKTIEPRTFSLRNSQSLFLGGLARLDLLYSASPSIRVTVCCSSNIPVTIVRTTDAADIYRSYIGSSLLGVPRGSDERIKKWPNLSPTNVRVKGIGNKSAADIVMSSAGFICISGKPDEDIDLRAWTPGGRGVYVRTESMLPFASNLAGKRQRKSPKYYSRDAVSISFEE